MMPVNELYQLISNIQEKMNPSSNINLRHVSIQRVFITTTHFGHYIYCLEDFKNFYHLFSKEDILRLEEELIKAL